MTRTATLTLKYDSSKQQELHLLNSQHTVGRDTTCNTWLNAPEISRKHFRITRNAGDLLIEDLDSSNGTKLNDTLLVQWRPCLLTDGDTIRAGTQEFVVHIAAAPYTTGNVPELHATPTSLTQASDNIEAVDAVPSIPSGDVTEDEFAAIVESAAQSARKKASSWTAYLAAKRAIEDLPCADTRRIA